MIEEVAEDIVASRRFKSWSVSINEVTKFLKDMRPETYAEVCACVHQLYAIRIGKYPLVWGDKNNYYLQHLELLQSLYPKAKFLFITRDPRDIFCSYKALKAAVTASEYAPKLTASVKNFCEEWQENYNIIQELRGRLSHEERGYLIRYEDLVSAPSMTIEGVFNFLGLSMEDQVLNYYKDSEDAFVEPEISIGWKQKTKNAPDPKNVGKYKALLSLCEQEEISKGCFGGMKDLNYL
jgi:hypothetical protein